MLLGGLHRSRSYRDLRKSAESSTAQHGGDGEIRQLPHALLRAPRCGEGMDTDSRSFMSHPRHEYFRRVLCNLIGNEIEAGELPDNDDLIGSMIRNICYENAARLLELPIPERRPVAQRITAESV